MFRADADNHSMNSSFYAFEPRAKIVGVIGFVICIALLRNLLVLYLSLAFILCMLALSGASWGIIGRRYLLAVPFILFASLSLYFTSGMNQSMAMFLRISSGVLAMILLTVSTPFFDLLHGLQRFKIPELIITLLLFTYRYIFVFQEELERMKQARLAKAHYGGGHLLNRRIMKTLANTAGMLLVRAYERGLRVQDSLKGRGFNGHIRVLGESRISWADLGFAGTFLFMASLLVLTEYGVIFS